ncbi:beta strand repeat-containing protein, partial [Escherichia coli]
MQRKTLLSACIALALSGQGWAADITEIETTTGEKKNTNVTCPADPGKLSPEELKRLPSECSPVVEQNLMPWLATGAATALITALAIVELNDDDDHHHRNNSPLPPTPPDDNSDDTPVPPTPGGDEIIPDDGSDDTPTPPKPISFNNDVILDKTAKTLTIRDSVFTYTENADGTISLQDSNGRKATINIWQIDEANNTVALDGVSADGATKWQYNHNGELVITGDNATVNNNGKTIVDGKDSTGTEIAGNNGKVIQDGILDVSGGGHGIDITGDGAIANTTGAITVADTDSVGIQVDGNAVTVSNDGDSTITNGGTGTQVNGNDAQVNNTGNTTVDGKNSTGTEITGNNGTVNLDGGLIVTGGAYGVEIAGDSAALNNEGDISVSDEGSIGVLINGEKATVSNTGDVNVSNNATGFDITTNEGNISLAGSMQVGDFSTGMDLNGNNNSVTLAAKDLNVTGQKATGVNVSGDANTINITGNVLVDKDQTADNAADYFYDPSVGINVNGSDNNVTLDGKLTVVADSELTTRGSAGAIIFDGSQENITGLSIAGDGNTFRLNGGIQLVGEANKLTDGSTIASERKGSGKVPLVSVDGKSSVHLNGDSTISGDVLLGNTQIIDLRNGAMLDVGADATINMQVDTYERYAMSADHLIDASSGSQLVNNGDINLRSIGFAAITGEDSFGSNTGNLTLSQYLDGLFANGGYGYLATKGASVVNTGTITTKVAEQESVINLGASLGFNDLVFYNAANSMTGLSAKTHGYVLNENGGKIEMFGRGNVGMLAIDESTAENAGQITLDALWVDVNDTTTLRDNIGNDARGYSVGMGVGTDAGSGPRKNATAVNQQSGVITVYNAGIGMAAYGAGNTVINQGTINLEKN